MMHALDRPDDQAVASTGPRPRGRGMLTYAQQPDRLATLQRGRARAGAECSRVKLNHRHERWASTGPRPRGRGMLALTAVVARHRQRFNGAAPARARNVD